MGSRFALITTFVLVSLASAVLADLSYPSYHEKAALGITLNMGLDDLEELMMPSNSSRRFLAGASHISYDALNKNRVPCNQRGSSYYNCAASGRANPYRRGCTAATRCARRN